MCYSGCPLEDYDGECRRRQNQPLPECAHCYDDYAEACDPPADDMPDIET